MQRHDRHKPAGRATVGCTGRKKQAVPVLMADALEREGLQGATLYHGMVPRLGSGHADARGDKRGNGAGCQT
jgi:hypothetical protein